MNAAPSARQVAMYFAWSQPDEMAAPMGELENRFAALFEVRRLFWPRFEYLADGKRFDQGIAGFVRHILLENFTLFRELAETWSGKSVRVAQRRTIDTETLLSKEFLQGVDTLIIVSFDSYRTGQRASADETGAVREFLADSNHTVFICPHHDIGNIDELPAEQAFARQEAEYHHHGDPAIPARQRFGGFGISLLHSLGLQVRNRFGLRPAKLPSGEPAPIEAARALDRLGLFDGVESLNLHPHLPHFEIAAASPMPLQVLVRQSIDLTAPPHPITLQGTNQFNAVLQTMPSSFKGSLLIGDATLWSSTAGGLEGMKRFWKNVTLQERRSSQS